MTSGKRLTDEERIQRAIIKKEKDRIYFKKYYEEHKEKISKTLTATMHKMHRAGQDNRH